MCSIIAGSVTLDSPFRRSGRVRVPNRKNLNFFIFSEVSKIDVFDVFMMFYDILSGIWVVLTFYWVCVKWL